MKKGLYFALIVLMVGAFAGCFPTKKVAEVATEQAVESATNGEVDVDVDGNKTTFVDEATGTKTEVGEDIDLPDGFPSDVPVYDDATIVAASTQGDTYYVTMTSTDAYDTIKTYYETEVPQEGWTVDNSSSLNIAGKTTTLIATQDTRELVVGVFEFDEEDEELGVTISLTVGEKQE